MNLDNGKFNYISHVEVIGDGIFAMVSVFSAQALCNVLLEKHGITNIQKGKFYPMNNWVAMLHEIQNRMPSIVMQIGKNIIQEAVFPPQLTFEQILKDSNKAYYMNHRGYKGDEIGHYLCMKISNKEYLFTINSPYPCLFNQGIILGYANRFNENISIKHKDKKCIEKGDSECCFHIHLNNSTSKRI